MSTANRTLAIIPARAGSKGIPGKNIRLLGGKPLIHWTIEAAISASGVDRVMVTTDSRKIADAAEAAGAEIPFLRPAELATDSAGAGIVIDHALDYYESQGDMFDTLVYLQPTSPFRDKHLINSAIDMFRANEEASSVIGVREAIEPIAWMRTISEDGYLENIKKASGENTVRQDYEKIYLLNGALFLTRVPIYRKYQSFYSGHTLPLVMDPYRSIDLDTMADWIFAEFILEKFPDKVGV